MYHVIRSVLESCQTVEESIRSIQEMPVASNVHIMLADRKGEAAVIEIIDGQKRVRRPETGYIAATNHPVADQTAKGMTKHHSVIRYDMLMEALKEQRSSDSLAKLFQTEYPDGLTVHNYEELFGTMRTVMFRPEEGTIDFCFRSPVYNPTYSLKAGGSLPFQEQTKGSISSKGLWTVILEQCRMIPCLYSVTAAVPNSDQLKIASLVESVLY
ncbi:C45 family autoproteolytic acyltransferase/hydrolase [Bacillus safensis]|uniref:C45 family autoproteolytic acyltransferase/hydolase n=1 Tax=Bacillus safensis TaxID=561879 RepID=UPI00381654C2